MAPDVSALKLRAEDEDDLAVISAFLQDALVPVHDLAYVPADRTFLFVANRFRWEDGIRRAVREGGLRRVLTGVTFSEVAAVFYTGFRRGDAGRILSLLAVRPETGAISLEFSGNAAIRLEAARVVCHMRDIGEPWPTPWQPRHEPEAQA
jgi:AcrR family transcriptional regulator